MTFSIVIPVYNQAEYLADAIESALPQGKVIVVDDGSTDHSASIAKGYPVKLIRQVNKGLPAARNTGIMNSTSNYIIFLDADDILKEECVNEIKKRNVNTDIIMWDFKQFGVQNQEVRLALPTLENMKTANRMAYCSAFKRSALLEIGGYNPKMKYGYEDYDMGIDLLKRGKTIAHIPEILFLYRTKEVSMITEAQKHNEELTNQMKLNHPEIYA